MYVTVNESHQCLCQAPEGVAEHAGALEQCLSRHARRGDGLEALEHLEVPLEEPGSCPSKRRAQVPHQRGIHARPFRRLLRRELYVAGIDVLAEKRLDLSG